MSVRAQIEHLSTQPLVRTMLLKRYERYFEKAQNCHLFFGVFRDFMEAELKATSMGRGSYDQEAPAAMYQDDLGVLRHTDYPVLFWFAKILPEVQSVFDFGGHVGVKYYAFKKYLEFNAILDWMVCDVAAVAQAGKRLAEAQQANQLSFVSSFSEGSARDMLLCSGSLQYVNPSLGNLLEELPERPKHVIINSTPFTDLGTFWTLNNIGTAICPYKIQNRKVFVTELESLGYQLVDTWENHGKDCRIPYFPEHSLSYYNGYYFRLSSRF